MNNQQKQLIKIFIFLFILSFIVINWNNISWIFNYRELDGLISDFFNPYPDTVKALINNNTTTYTTYISSNQNNSLEIPSIALSTPIIMSMSTNKKELAKDLDRGAAYYPGSVLPGENGQIIILGHSAPPNWPHIKHDYIFSGIEKLNTGDQIILTFNNKKYIYKATDKKIIQAGQDVTPLQLSGNVLTLISCWPPGENYQRIAVSAELEKR